MNFARAPQATYGLKAIASPSSPTASGNVNLGVGPTTVTLGDADVFYAIEALIVGSASDLLIELTDGDKTGSTAWTAGTAQQETATAVGTVTLAGSAEVIVTAAGMTGTPKTIAVAVALNDTAATWAGKVRAALAADADVSALFTVDGTSTAIRLTRKPLATYTVGAASVPTYPANDGTLNISLDNGTCTGITTAASSANTTAGVLSAGCYVVGDGVDFEGNELTPITKIISLIIKSDDSSTNDVFLTKESVIDALTIRPGEVISFISSNSVMSEITLEPQDNALVTIVVAGES